MPSMVEAPQLTCLKHPSSLLVTFSGASLSVNIPSKILLQPNKAAIFMAGNWLMVACKACRPIHDVVKLLICHGERCTNPTTLLPRRYSSGHPQGICDCCHLSSFQFFPLQKNGIRTYVHMVHTYM